jgi:hypothetical protein
MDLDDDLCTAPSPEWTVEGCRDEAGDHTFGRHVRRVHLRRDVRAPPPSASDYLWARDSVLYAQAIVASM